MQHFIIVRKKIPPIGPSATLIWWLHTLKFLICYYSFPIKVIYIKLWRIIVGCKAFILKRNIFHNGGYFWWRQQILRREGEDFYLIIKRIWNTTTLPSFISNALFYIRLDIAILKFVDISKNDICLKNAYNNEILATFARKRFHLIKSMNFELLNVIADVL